MDLVFSEFMTYFQFREVTKRQRRTILCDKAWQAFPRAVTLCWLREYLADYLTFTLEHTKSDCRVEFDTCTHTTPGAVLLCPLLLGHSETAFCSVWLNSITRKTDLAGAELGPRERSCDKMLPKGTNQPTEDEISFSFCYSLTFSPYVFG